jgi:hypothetical protein
MPADGLGVVDGKSNKDSLASTAGREYVHGIFRDEERRMKVVQSDWRSRKQREGRGEALDG